jgi:hypothetical protein
MPSTKDHVDQGIDHLGSCIDELTRALSQDEDNTPEGGEYSELYDRLDRVRDELLTSQTALLLLGNRTF